MGILRLGGLVSGLDTETLIAQLMAIERRPVVLAQQRQSDLETERNVWKDIGTRLNNLLNRVNELKAGAAGFSSGKATSSDETVLAATGQAGATPGIYNVTVTQLASAHSVKSKLFDSSSALGISGTFKITMNPSPVETLEVQIQLDGTENIYQIQSKIANARTADGKKLPLTATVVQVNSTQAHLVLTANYTGASSQITFTDVAPGTAAADLGFTDPANKLQDPLDAKLDVNGIKDITRSSNTISDVIPGVTLELRKGGGAAATVTVVRDIDRAVSTVRAFVDQYNSLVDFVSEKSTFDSQTKKAGPLLGDSTATQVLRRVRQNTLDPVYSLPAQWQQAAQVGLTGEPFRAGNASSLQKLSLDESELRSALEQNPQAVADLFDAIAGRLARTIEGYTNSSGILSKKDKSFEDQINRVKEQIGSMERRLELREQNLRRQFEALESSLERLKAQQASLLAQLAGIGGGQQ